MPIGSIEVINNFKPEEIRTYYHKWYRPDLQGIIIVGNVDVYEMEKKSIDLFSPIKLDPDRAERKYYPVPDNEEPIVAFFFFQAEDGIRVADQTCALPILSRAFMGPAARWCRRSGA